MTIMMMLLLMMMMVVVIAVMMILNDYVTFHMADFSPRPLLPAP